MPLPEHITSDPELTIRSWLVSDAEALAAPVEDSSEQLRLGFPVPQP